VSKTSPYRNARRTWKRWRFKRSGMKPWTKGYLEHRQHEIVRVLNSGEFQRAELPAGYGFRLDERIIEYPWLFARLPTGPGWLLDAGSVLNFDFLLGLPSLQSKRVHICTLAPEAECSWLRGVSYVFDDLRKLPYREALFDWVVCLSTLEHVGMDNTLLYTGDHAKREAQSLDYLVALRELKRVLKPGGTVYISVPFGKAADLGWYQVFDQRMIESVVGAFQPASFTVDYFLYHPDGWRTSSAQEAAGATVFDIHHAKGYDPDFAAAARAVCCLELKQ
jgi:SAM-dependent methyltransferase